MEQESKQQWKRPQLIVLGRGTPEEKVLLGCKNPNGAPGPNGDCGNKNCSGNAST